VQVAALNFFLCNNQNKDNEQDSDSDDVRQIVARQIVADKSLRTNLCGQIVAGQIAVDKTSRAKCRGQIVAWANHCNISIDQK
ncbi:unnamed protein product, partial [Rotaria socialis]